MRTQIWDGEDSIAVYNWCFSAPGHGECRFSNNCVERVVEQRVHGMACLTVLKSLGHAQEVIAVTGLAQIQEVEGHEMPQIKGFQ